MLTLDTPLSPFLLMADTPLMIRLELATARYHATAAIIESQLTPVATSVGLPKWPLAYEIAAQSKLVAPYGLLAIDDRHEFEQRYRTRLDRIGADRILAGFEEIATRAGRRGLVLLCFEDIAKPGVWCHRRLLAEWLIEQTGLDVPELRSEG